MTFCRVRDSFSSRDEVTAKRHLKCRQKPSSMRARFVLRCCCCNNDVEMELMRPLLERSKAVKQIVMAACLVKPVAGIGMKTSTYCVLQQPGNGAVCYSAEGRLTRFA